MRAAVTDCVGCTEPKANCTIKRRIGAVRLRLSAPYVLEARVFVTFPL